MNSSKTKALGKKIKDKVIDVTSDVLSAPKRAYYGRKSRISNAHADLFREAREVKNAPSRNLDGTLSGPAKTRILAEIIRGRYENKNK